MTDLPVPHAARTRRVLGVLVFGLAAVALVLFALGLWNPWRLVVLWRYFSSPAIGLVVVMGMACLASWLALPVRNEAAQPGRIALRIVTVLGAFAGLFCWGVTGPTFTPEITVLARTPGGERAVALVERGDSDRQLHLWAGKGLTTRDFGSIGPACGVATIRFPSRDRVSLDTSYGDWNIDLDPVTGRPLQVLGPNCADGPRPATMGR